MSRGEESGCGGGDESVVEEAAGASRRSDDRDDDLPEPYLRWLEAQIPAIAATSKSNKQPTRWYSRSTDVDDRGGGGVGGKGKKQLNKGWFTLQWTMDNMPIIPDGLWLEFGVFSGESIALMATHPKAPKNIAAVHGFDSFVDWNVNRFDRGGALPAVPPNVELVAGWFEDTLPSFLQRPDIKGRPAAFVHVDGDLYSSAWTVLRELSAVGAIVPGTVLVFDELLHYPGWESNEALALWEWLGKPDPRRAPPRKEEKGLGEQEEEGVSAAAGGVGFDIQWVCVKDRVMPLSECLRKEAMSNWKRMIAQGYDQTVAGVVTTTDGTRRCVR